MVGQIAGPRVTRYELQLAPGTKMSKVAALKDDLSYALATTEIRILAPIPGKQAVGVEVPNLSPNLVTLGDIFDDLPASASPLVGLARQGHLGQRRLDRPRADAAPAHRRHHRLGQVRLHQHDADLDPAPLDARTTCASSSSTRSGSSSSYYERIPHLLTPVVSSPKEASAVLTNVVAEMERRYERLSSVRARNLPEANRALPQPRRADRCRTCWS